MATPKQRKKSSAKQRGPVTNKQLSESMKGNQNALGRGAWSDAIRRSVARAAKSRGEHNYLIINKLADKLVASAGKGNIQALKELGDRLDGKPAQVIQGPGEDGEFVTQVNINVVGRKDG